MAVETLRPSAAGAETNISFQFPASDLHYDKVDEAVSDEDTTHVYSESITEYERDFYNVADSGVGEGTINHVTVFVEAKSNAPGVDQAGLKIALKSGTTSDEGDAETITTSYASYSKQWTVNPDTSAAFVWAAIDSLQIGIAIRRSYASIGSTRVTQVYVEVDYTLAEGGAQSIRMNLFGINIIRAGGR